MKTVEVSESALESLKAMVERLQSERDELLSVLSIANWYLSNGCQVGFPVKTKIKEIINKCTQTQSICDWKEKMNG